MKYKIIEKTKKYKITNFKKLQNNKNI